MRILVLCKRQYTGRDLLDDRYGRLYELPKALAARGHEITVLATSYRLRGAVDRVEGGVSWRSMNVLPLPWGVVKRWRDAALALEPDVIVGSSDALHLVGAERLARAMGLPCALDLYDDYEAFGLTRVPGVRRLLRDACQRAEAVFVVSTRLAAMVTQRGVQPQRVHLLRNGVPEDFAPHATRLEARSRLGLPLDVQLVGTAGALDGSRGITDLFEAVRGLQTSHPKLRLVLAGRLHRNAEKRLPAGTLQLGTLCHADVALLFRALDVGVVCNRDAPFARACHPMKLVELVACGTPVVAADVGEVTRLLSGRADALYTPGDHEMLSDRIRQQLLVPLPLKPQLADRWLALAESMAGALRGVVQSSEARSN